MRAPRRPEVSRAPYEEGARRAVRRRRAPPALQLLSHVGVLSLVALPCCSRGAAHESTGTSAIPTTAASAAAPTNAAATISGTPGSEGPPGHQASGDTSAPSGGVVRGDAPDAGGAKGTGVSGDAPDARVAWARRLSPVVFRDVNTLADVTLRLYKDDGAIDDAAAAEVERVLWSAKDEAPLRVSRRLLQLVVKVADHFDTHEIQVISSHRGKASKGSRHRSGEAIDFALPGVPSKKVAEVLRTYARVGVGEYIHPRSQFVHLDVREQSYHWIDSSPPKRSWREHPLPDVTATTRDGAYAPAQDLPDSAN